jgi:hypothetical protein
VDEIVPVILGWDQAKRGFHVNALAGHLSFMLDRVVSEAEIIAALTELGENELIEQDNGIYRLSEPDRPELELYGPLEAGFQTEDGVLSQLGIDRHQWVFQRTAAGGIRGAGRLSMPDFTLAAIKAWRFDPGRSLEVYSFEVKRRSGTTMASVYEAVAHGRFAHYPYLVCPRSYVDPALNSDISKACVREGVGLILFDIVAVPPSRFRIERIQLVEEAARRSPDPQAIEEHLSKRLSATNCQKLERLARGENA